MTTLWQQITISSNVELTPLVLLQKLKLRLKHSRVHHKRYISLDIFCYQLLLKHLSFVEDVAELLKTHMLVAVNVSLLIIRIII